MLEIFKNMSTSRKQLKILVPEYGAGGDHPTEGFLMKGLEPSTIERNWLDGNWSEYVPDFQTTDTPHDLEAFYSYRELDDFN